MNIIEELLLDYAGKLIMLIGFGGIVFTVLFDKIARGLFQQFGWLQIAGIVVFFAIFVIGWSIDEMLRKAKDMIEQWLGA